jgi:hypothetical protein
MLMISRFGIVGFLLAPNLIAFWGVAELYLVEYMSIVGEYVN